MIFWFLGLGCGRSLRYAILIKNKGGKAILKTDTIIKQEGINALISKLGYVDAERFIVLITKEPFDYTKWREQSLNEELSIRELSKKAMAYSKNL